MQHSYTFWTDEVPSTTPVAAEFNRASHLILEYDSNNIYDRVTRERIPVPPEPSGISGGIAAHRQPSGAMRLAAIMTDFRENERIMVGTRMCEVFAFARTLQDQKVLHFGHY